MHINDFHWQLLLHCCICKTLTPNTIRNRSWNYCVKCASLAQFETALLNAADQWRYVLRVPLQKETFRQPRAINRSNSFIMIRRVNVIPAPEPPPEDALKSYATLRDLIAPLPLRDPVDAVIAEFEKAGVTGEEWRNRLYQLCMERAYYRLPLSKATLSAINQTVYPREGARESTYILQRCSP